MSPRATALSGGKRPCRVVPPAPSSMNRLSPSIPVGTVLSPSVASRSVSSVCRSPR